MEKLLILGGTGIVGTASALEALDKGFDVTVSGIDKTPPKHAKFVHANDLDKLKKNWDAVFDVYTFGRKNAEQTHRRFKDKTGHLFVMSSTLVYDRDKLSYERIKPNHKLAEKGSQGGYVDHKLELENYWDSVDDMNWTILRPYHIVGKGSYLGCLPPHNRDPHLIHYIRRGKIDLCDGGRVPINIVNPKDIGKTVLSTIGRNFGKKYNVVNPEEVIARDYYLKIAELLGRDLEIGNISGENIWDSGDWKLTTLPHLYDVSDLEEDRIYVPSTGLRESLREAMDNHPFPIKKDNTPVHKRMHMQPEPVMHSYFSDSTPK